MTLNELSNASGLITNEITFKWISFHSIVVRSYSKYSCIASSLFPCSYQTTPKFNEFFFSNVFLNKYIFQSISQEIKASTEAAL